MTELNALTGTGPVSIHALGAATQATSALLSSLSLDTNAAGTETSPNATAPVNEQIAVAAALRNVVGLITAAAVRAAQVGGEPVIVSTPALNISAQLLPVSNGDRRLSLATPIVASLSTETTQAAVQLPADLLSNLTAVSNDSSSPEPIGLQMWTSSLDLHGTGSSNQRTLAGPTVSVSLSQGGQELDVHGVATPILVAMPLDAGMMNQLASATGAARPCVGQLSSTSFFERAQGGDNPCTSVVACNFWDTATNTWSSDGCRTVALANGGMACECTHLTDFIAVMVPSTFDNEIEFAQLDVDTNLTLQCACNRGIDVVLHKAVSGATPRPLSVDVIDATDMAWRLLEVVYVSPTPVDWLALEAPNGTRSNPIRLNMSATGLPEQGPNVKYQASVVLELVSDSFATRNVTIPVDAEVSASVVANMSTWGLVLPGARCSSDREQPPVVRMHLGDQHDATFTACDADGLPVAHELPTELDRRTFRATLDRLDSFNSTKRATRPMSIQAIGGSSYRVNVLATESIGTHLLTVYLAGEHIPWSVPIIVTCPLPLVPFDNNRSCACPPGTESSALGGCSACEAGTFQTHPSTNPCQPCPPGSIAEGLSNQVCIPCPQELHQIRAGQERCESCPPTTSTNGKRGEAECTSCATGYFNLLPDVAASIFTCRRCIAVAGCTNNATIANLDIRPGYWRLSPMSLDVKACLTKRQSGANATQVISSCTGGTNASNYCDPEHYGPLCMLCTERDNQWKYFNTRARRCDNCPDPVPKLVGITATLVLLFMVVAGIQLPLRHAQVLVVHVQARVRLVLNLMGLQAKLKCFVGLYQFLDEISPVFDIDMPIRVIELLDKLEVLRLDPGIFFPGACLGSFFARLLVQTTGPLVLICSVMVAFVIRGVACGGHQNVASGMRSGLASAIPLMLLLGFVFVTPTSVAVFDSFTCTEFQQNDQLYNEPASRRDEQAVVFFLKADYSVRCGPWLLGAMADQPRSPKHDAIKDLAFVMLLVWPVALPVLYLGLLWNSRHALKAKRPTRSSRAIHFLHGDYKKEYYAWEVLDITRRLVLVGFVRFLPKDDLPISRLITGAAISLVFLFSVLWLRPYRHDVDNMVSALMHLTIMLMLLAGCLVEAHQRAMSSLENGAAASLTMLGFESLQQMSVVLVFIPTFTASAMVFVIILSLRFMRFPRTMLDQATGEVVQLSLAKQHKFHLFLSHIWGTGQDQVAAIKRQVCLLLPGISVFLDVDDLEEISALERYIDETAVVLVFLSRGYFGSKNCLREVVASVHKKKPVVLVWEPEVPKGGASIASLKAELYEKAELIETLGSTPGECEEYIFRTSQADGRPTIPWFRVFEFQRKSLVMIAQAALVSTPAYIKKKELRLYMSDAINVSTMVCTEHVCLYASPLNPGAAEVAHELVQALEGLTTTRKPPPGGDEVDLGLPQQSSGSSTRNLRGSSVRGVRKEAAQEAHEATATHFVLYLSTETFTGEAGLRFAEQVRRLRKQNVPCLMIHENDPARNGCEFGTFFTTTPQDLIDDGLFGALALNFSWGVHRQVSLGIAAKVLGAVQQQQSLRSRYTHLQKQTSNVLKRALPSSESLARCSISSRRSSETPCASADGPPSSSSAIVLDVHSEVDAQAPADSANRPADTAPPTNDESGFAAQPTPACGSMHEMGATVPEGWPPSAGHVALRKREQVRSSRTTQC